MNVNNRIELIKLLVKREFNSKYGRTILGYFWPLVQPLATLILYSFVFIVIFKVQWGDTTTAPFPLIFFAGLIVFYFFSDVLNQSSTLFASNANYIKKIRFPLSLLPIKAVMVHSVQLCVNLGVWFLVAFIFDFEIPFSSFGLFILIFLLIGLGIALSTFIATIGVFWKDVGQISPLLNQFLLFTSPIFYPLSSVPEIYRAFMFLNPLTIPVELIRALIIFGNAGGYILWLGLFLQLVFFSLIATLFYQFNENKFVEHI